MFEEKVDYFLVDKLLGLVHFHFGCAKVMKQRITFGFLNYPVGVRSILDEQLSDQKTYLFVLKAITFLDESEEDRGEGIVIEGVRFVDLSCS